MHQLHDMRRCGRPARAAAPAGRAALDLRQQIVGRADGRARGQHLVRQPSEILDERELQHARPRPELPDRQRGDALIAVEKRREPRNVEPAVAVADQFDGNRVDAGFARVLPQRQRRELAVVGAREIPADVENVRRHEVKVVEEPFGRGRHEAAVVHVGREGAVHLAKHARVLFEPGKDAAAPPPAPGIHGEACRERHRALVEPLDAEQLIAEGFEDQRDFSSPAVMSASRAAAAAGWRSPPRRSARPRPARTRARRRLLR